MAKRHDLTQEEKEGIVRMLKRPDITVNVIVTAYQTSYATVKRIAEENGIEPRGRSKKFGQMALKNFRKHEIKN